MNVLYDFILFGLATIGAVSMIAGFIFLSVYVRLRNIDRRHNEN